MPATAESRPAAAHRLAGRLDREFMVCLLGLACRFGIGTARRRCGPARPAGGRHRPASPAASARPPDSWPGRRAACAADRKSTRLNSSHTVISYAVFCLTKKKSNDVHTDSLAAL